MNRLVKHQITRELERLQEQNETGLLTAGTVVEAARDEDSPLHQHFEWDNDVAGERYRLIQARQLIRAIIVNEDITGREVRNYVSVPSDRSQPGGGYRTLSNVISISELRQEKLVELQKIMDSHLERYEAFLALEPDFVEIRRLIPRFNADRMPGSRRPPNQASL